jgi:formylmethanofuran dehydrogenase subunit E
MNINIADVQAFHGHMCPGLAIGIRVAEQALLEMGERPGDEEVVAIVETDNCAVDAIQYLTGCTFGKGNLIHMPYGKNAFRFIRRSDGKAIRILVKMNKEGGPKKSIDNTAANTPEDEELLRRQRVEMILSAPLEDLLEVTKIKAEIPPCARIYNSVACDSCGEMTMEIRLRLLNGKAYCPECFEKAARY